MNLTKHLSSPEIAFKAVSSSSTHLQSSTGSNGRSAVHELVNVHQRECFKDSSFYKEIQEIFDGLDEDRKFLLSCFTVFPENAEVKRRIFVYWGVGEELWNDSVFEDDETPENIVDGILKEFQEKGLIEPAIKKQKLHVKSYKMNPLVRSAVTMLSQEAGNLFDYDDKGDVLPQRCRTSEGVEVNVRFPSCKRMCLLKDEEEDQEQTQKDLLEKKPSIPEESQSTSSLNSEGTDLGKLVTLFNVNEPFPDLELAWLMKKKVINEQKKKGIYAEQIKEPTAVDWLSKMKEAKVVSRLPKELSALVQLRVLKGFVISNPQRKGSATLDDLKELKKLRELTINANSKDFPTDEDLSALQQIGGGGILRKLTIAWVATLANQQGEAQIGGDASCWKIFKSAPKQHNPKTVTEELPKQLEKLDLQCFPNSTSTWLTPDSLPLLEKLYIRGGNLATLDRSKWLKVQALHLNYLRELKMNWRELIDSFSDLVYLEKVKCPGITLCPCDEHGVWMKK
nr:disease resistance RPP13-like protein 4 [Quercus suber]